MTFYSDHFSNTTKWIPIFLYITINHVNCFRLLFIYLFNKALKRHRFLHDKKKSLRTFEYLQKLNKTNKNNKANSVALLYLIYSHLK